MKKNHTLTKQDSAALKGIAILLMIFHHCFLDPSRFAGHIVSFAPFSQSAIVSLSYFSKICVGIFAFISGYGLYLSAVKQPRSAKAVSGWTVSRLIKTMSGYWLVYILALITTWIYAGLPVKTYCTNGNIRGLLYGALDFLGVASLFKTPTMNSTWWYMGAAVLFIVLVPLFIRITEKFGYTGLCILIIMLPRLLKVGYPGAAVRHVLCPTQCVRPFRNIPTHAEQNDLAGDLLPVLGCATGGYLSALQPHRTIPGLGTALRNRAGNCHHLLQTVHYPYSCSGSDLAVLWQTRTEYFLGTHLHSLYFFPGLYLFL